jgi:chromosome segregation ATPase
MAFSKKKPVDDFRVPSLAEASPEYAALLQKQQGLQQSYSDLNTERTRLRRDIEAEKAAGGQRLAPDVARLLGDDPTDSVTALSERLRKVATEMGNIESAQEVLRRRIDEARNRASKTVCDTVRQEYERRLGNLCKLLVDAEAARQSHDELLDDIEREDVHNGFLRPVHPHFMGDRRDGRVSYFLKEVKEAGHNA